MRPSNTEERRREISHALLRVMAAEGYERATIVRVAKEAGIAPGLVHYHFDSKAVRCWALVGAEAVKDAEVRALYEAHLGTLVDRLAAWVVEACHDDGRSGEGARAVAGAVAALTEGYFALAAASPALVAAGSASGMAKRMLRGLLAAQPRKEGR